MELKKTYPEGENTTEIKICPKCMQETADEDYCPSCGYKLNSNIKSNDNTPSKTDAEAQVCTTCIEGVYPKNPILSLALSLIFPGMGQFYNYQINKGVIFVIAFIISILLCFILIGIPLVLVIWLYSMYDAFTSARAMNRGETLEDKIF